MEFTIVQSNLEKIWQDIEAITICKNTPKLEKITFGIKVLVEDISIKIDKITKKMAESEKEVFE